MGVSGDLGQFITPRRDRKCRGVTHVKNRRIQVYVFARCSESFSISRGFRIAKWFAQKFFNQKNKEAAMYFWKPFYITCSTCGHRNRPHPSPHEAVRLTLLGHAGNCRGCGKQLRPRLSDRPLVKQVRKELAAAGIQTCC